MESFLYKFRCPGQYWGYIDGVRNVFTNASLSDEKALQLAKQDIKKSTNNNDCSVALLVKYKLSIESVKTYPDITKIPFSNPEHEKKPIGFD